MRQLVRFKWGMRGQGIRKKSCYIEPIEIAGSLTAKHCGDCTSDCSNGVLVYNQPCKVLKPYGSTGGIGGVKLKENAKDIAAPVTARDYKGILRNNGDAIMEIKIVGNKNPSGHGQGGVVYDAEGIIGALNVAKATAPNVAVRAVCTPEYHEKHQNGRRVKDEGEPMFTLTAQDRHGVAIAYDEQNNTLRTDGTVGTLTTDGSSPKHNNRVIVGGLPIREATNKGYSVAYPGDGVNIGMPSSTTRRGRVNHGLANTLTTTSEMGVVDHAIRIRRLTPRECWRLQGFPDSYFDKAKAAGISDTQLYKMAGNAVTVNVARAIGEKLKELEDEEAENEFSY